MYNDILINLQVRVAGLLPMLDMERSKITKQLESPSQKKESSCQREMLTERDSVEESKRAGLIARSREW